MDKKKKYVELWEKDADEMSINGLYDWMSDQIENYKTILEIGCGSGISTLNLLKRGHNVISIEFNKYCIDKTKKLLEENGYNYIEIINEQISENNCIEIVHRIKSKVDLVICWNPGGAHYLSSEEKISKIMEFWRNGYKEPVNDYVYNYSEDLIRSACRIGKELNIDTHIIDRYESEIGEISDYIEIGQYGFNKIISNQIRGMSNKNTMEENKEILYKSFLLTR